MPEHGQSFVYNVHTLPHIPSTQGRDGVSGKPACWTTELSAFSLQVTSMRNICCQVEEESAERAERKKQLLQEAQRRADK